MNKNDLLNLVHKAGKLKTTIRTGWARKGVAHPESVSDHTWRVSLLCLLLAEDFKLNKERVVAMSIIHDLGEIEIGDIRWEEGGKVIGDKTKKHQDELETIKNLFKNSPNLEQYVEIWKEFNEQITPEAKFVKGLDKLEMAMQALEYEQQGHPLEWFDEFWENSEKYLTDSNLEEHFLVLKAKRNRPDLTR